MKRSLLYFTFCLSLSMLLTPLKAEASPKTAPAPKATPPCSSTDDKTCPKSGVKPDKYELNILELTNSQMYRYGREMFLSGNNAEAAKVFLEIIRLDCHNRQAHYHLQKIAERDPAYAFLNKTLKNLPCGTYDFTREDFLPASVYYEKDPQLILDQLLVYHKRQRLTENELKTQAEKYTALIEELEGMVAALSRLPQGASTDNEILERVISGRKIANKFDKEIIYLKSQLESERLTHQKELQDLRTSLAAGEAELAAQENQAQGSSLTTSPETTAKTPSYSEGGQDLAAAVEKARKDLEDKEIQLAEKDRILKSLQERFEEILERLKVIERDLANKNAQIKEIQTNLQNTQKP